MWWYIAGGIILTAYTALLIALRVAWKKQKEIVVPRDFRPDVRFSIIIPARNEERSLPSCLDAIAKLDYPHSLYEVIVIDDFSTDQTADIAIQKGVRLIELKDHLKSPVNSYKKKAIETGIQAANGEYIVTTDADCIVPEGWLATFSRIIHEKGPVLIAAPVRMQATKRLLDIFQSLDFLSLQGVTGASASSGKMSLSNGANLCYSKKAFEQVNGFEGIDQIASGDDLLLMHKLSTAFPGKTEYAHSRNCIVDTKTEPTLGAFLQQRMRWASKAMFYKDKRITGVLGLVYLVNLFPLLTGIGGSFEFHLYALTLGFIIAKIFAELFFLFPVASFFRQTSLLKWFLFMQPFHIFYTVIVGLAGGGGRYRWKERTVK